MKKLKPKRYELPSGYKIVSEFTKFKSKYIIAHFKKERFYCFIFNIGDQNPRYIIDLRG